MKRRTALLALVATLLLCASPALAQPAITWSTIDCGGGTSTGGAFTLSGTIGQFDAAPPAAGGAFTVTGGYWTYKPCPPDFNADGVVSIDDLFLYINAYFSGAPTADFNGFGGVTIDDLFLYINAYFTGC